MLARKATLPDALAIHDLIAAESRDATLLPRTLPDICENIRDFTVIEQEREVLGCGALHLYGIHLAEVRSITIEESYRGRGAGQMLIQALMSEAERHQVSCVCLFTRMPQFFGRLGFRVVPHDALPDKAYKDCHQWPRKNACDEIAMVQGELPTFAILQPAFRPELLRVLAPKHHP
jgi:amino-acid N-acetyltransferase